ncbi:MAG: mandelate racemase, partial [Candidatus Sulfotelmatobacter sp.]
MFDKGKTKITGSKVEVFRVPTDAPEADGTYAWDSTTMVLVHVEVAGKSGLGYTYADESTAKLAHTILQKVVAGRDVFSQAAIRQDIYRHVRNLGETG